MNNDRTHQSMKSNKEEEERMNNDRTHQSDERKKERKKKITINTEKVIWIGRIYLMKNRKQYLTIPMVYGTTTLPDDNTIRSNEDDTVRR